MVLDAPCPDELFLDGGPREHHDQWSRGPRTSRLRSDRRDHDFLPRPTSGGRCGAVALDRPSEGRVTLTFLIEIKGRGLKEVKGCRPIWEDPLRAAWDQIGHRGGVVEDAATLTGVRSSSTL